MCQRLEAHSPEIDNQVEQDQRDVWHKDHHGDREVDVDERLLDAVQDGDHGIPLHAYSHHGVVTAILAALAPMLLLAVVLVTLLVLVPAVGPGSYALAAAHPRRGQLPKESLPATPGQNTSRRAEQS